MNNKKSTPSLKKFASFKLETKKLASVVGGDTHKDTHKDKRDLR